MLKQFRTHYPDGSLISELIEIDRGQYIVKVTLQINETILATGLAAADKVESAEDRARERALLALALDSIPKKPDASVKVEKSLPRVINNSADVVNLPPQPEESTTKKEVSPVDPLAVNTPYVSTFSTVAKKDSVANNNSANSSNSHQSPVASTKEIEPINFNSSYADLPSATESLYNEELTELQSKAHLPNAVPGMAEISMEKSDNSQQEVTSNQPLEIVEFNFNEIKIRTDVEIKRLGWTQEQGRDFLLATYGKRSRLHLTDEELMDFLRYLESQ